MFLLGKTICWKQFLLEKGESDSLHVTSTLTAVDGEQMASQQQPGNGEPTRLTNGWPTVFRW